MDPFFNKLEADRCEEEEHKLSGLSEDGVDQDLIPAMDKITHAQEKLNRHKQAKRDAIQQARLLLQSELCSDYHRASADLLVNHNKCLDRLSFVAAQSYDNLDNEVRTINGMLSSLKSMVESVSQLPSSVLRKNLAERMSKQVEDYWLTIESSLCGEDAGKLFRQSTREELSLVDLNHLRGVIPEPPTYDSQLSRYFGCHENMGFVHSDSSSDVSEESRASFSSSGSFENYAEWLRAGCMEPEPERNSSLSNMEETITKLSQQIFGGLQLSPDTISLVRQKMAQLCSEAPSVSDEVAEEERFVSVGHVEFVFNAQNPYAKDGCKVASQGSNDGNAAPPNPSSPHKPRRIDSGISSKSSSPPALPSPPESPVAEPAAVSPSSPSAALTHLSLHRDGSGLHSDNNTGASLPSVNSSCSNNNHRRRKRGKRGGVRLRLRKMQTMVPLPSVVLANVRSFGRHNDTASDGQQQNQSACSMTMPPQLAPDADQENENRTANSLPSQWFQSFEKRLTDLEASQRTAARVGEQRRLKLEVKLTTLQEDLRKQEADFVKVKGEIYRQLAEGNTIPTEHNYQQFIQEKEKVAVKMETAEQLAALSQELADRAQVLAATSQDQTCRAAEQTAEAQQVLQQLQLLKQEKSNCPAVGFQAYVEKKIISKRKAGKLMMADVQCNVGSAYDALWGVFTAPVDGLYQFNLQASSEDASRAASLYLMQQLAKNATGSKVSSKSSAYDIGYVFSEGYYISSASVVVKLEAGDKVWPETDREDVFAYSCETGLGGVLLRPT